MELKLTVSEDSLKGDVRWFGDCGDLGVHPKIWCPFRAVLTELKSWVKKFLGGGHVAGSQCYLIPKEHSGIVPPEWRQNCPQDGGGQCLQQRLCHVNMTWQKGAEQKVWHKGRIWRPMEGYEGLFEDCLVKYSPWQLKSKSSLQQSQNYRIQETGCFLNLRLSALST